MVPKPFSLNLDSIKSINFKNPYEKEKFTPKVKEDFEKPDFSIITNNLEEINQNDYLREENKSSSPVKNWEDYSDLSGEEGEIYKNLDERINIPVRDGYKVEELLLLMENLEGDKLKADVENTMIINEIPYNCVTQMEHTLLINFNERGLSLEMIGESFVPKGEIKENTAKFVAYVLFYTTLKFGSIITPSLVSSKLTTMLKEYSTIKI